MVHKLGHSLDVADASIMCLPPTQADKILHAIGQATPYPVGVKWVATLGRVLLVLLHVISYLLEWEVNTLLFTPTLLLVPHP
jgi:hypothetical protein